MFEALKNLDDAQVEAGALALAAGLLLVTIDASGVFLAIKGTEGYKTSFTLVKFVDKAPVSVPLTPLQYAVVDAWAKLNIPKLVGAWRLLE